MLKKISVIAIALTVMGVGSLQAKEANSSNDSQQVQTSTQASISKSDAKKIIKKYLKSKKAYKKLRVGQIKKVSETWKIKLTSSNNIPVSTVYVNDKTGKITFKR